MPRLKISITELPKATPALYRRSFRSSSDQAVMQVRPQGPPPTSPLEETASQRPQSGNVSLTVATALHGISDCLTIRHFYITLCGNYLNRMQWPASDSSS